MRLLAVVIGALMLASQARAGEVTYYRFGPDTYGSDGSRAHEFAGVTRYDDGHGHRWRCHDFAGRTRCEDE